MQQECHPTATNQSDNELLNESTAQVPPVLRLSEVLRGCGKFSPSIVNCISI